VCNGGLDDVRKGDEATAAAPSARGEVKAEENRARKEGRRRLDRRCIAGPERPGAGDWLREESSDVGTEAVEMKPLPIRANLTNEAVVEKAEARMAVRGSGLVPV
jgi:hypothetical protein